MARVTVEDCLEKVENRFALVLLVSKRAKQMLKGAQTVMPNKDKNKYIVTSLREVASGYTYFDPDESNKSAEQQIVAELAR